MKGAGAALMLAAFSILAGPAAAAPRAPAPAARTAPAPIEIRMVIVTAFEIGKDTGDMPGELQAWADEIPLTLPFPAGDRPLRYDPARKLLVLSTGVGTGRAAVTTMALGSDPRFDLSHAYWLIAAIAGVNPNEASIGSAAWIGDLVDTDLGYLIDAREIPADWPTGMVPLSRSKPYETPLPDTKGNLFRLDKGLRDWAFALTRDIELADSDGLRRVRGRYTGYPTALTPPVILRGDEATGQGFWHGKILNEHTERWVRYWTGGEGRFVMTGMEDTGVARAIDALASLGRADAKRLMVLRTASNYTLPPPGMTVADSLKAESQELTGLRASLDAAHRIGRRVADEITGRWATYRNAIPRRPAR